MVRSMTKRGMPKPFAILIAALLALYFVPFVAMPAQAATVGGFEIEGNLMDDTVADPPIDWSDLGPGTAGFSTGVDNVNDSGQDTTTFKGASKEFNLQNEAGGWPNWEFGTGNATGKSDFGRWATYDFVDDDDHVWFFFGFDRGFGTGTAKYAFELNQLTQSPTTDANPDRSQGDIRLVIYDQGNGTVTLTADASNPDVGLYVWDDPDFAGLGAAGPDTDQDGFWVKSADQTGVFSGASNTGDAPIAVPSWWTGGNVENGTLSKDTFLEFGIDLTSFGAVLGCPSAGFTAVNARSITGTGGPGTLVDYLAAIPVTIPSNCANLVINKEDEDGDPLGGATFRIEPNPLPVGTPGRPSDNFLIIFDDSGPNTTVETGTNYDDPDATAGKITLAAVVPGVEYTITEVVPPAGYIGETGSKKVTPAPFGGGVVTFVNKLGSVMFFKAYEGPNGEVPAGATFNVVRDSDGDTDFGEESGANVITVQDNGANDEDPTLGEIKLSDLLTGDYRIRETNAPTGWIADGDDVFFSIPGDNNTADVVLSSPTFNDPRATYPLQVKKLGVVPNQPDTEVAGAVFVLWRDTNGTPGLQKASDTNAGTCTTGANGTCSVSNQPWGFDYFWEETSVPAPWNLPNVTIQGPVHLNADGSTSPTGPTVFTDPKSKIVTQATNGNLPNATISDTATLSGVNENATGTVTFDLYFTGQTEPTATSCVPANAVTLGIPATALVDGPGNYSTGPISVSQAGYYAWVAHYSGDANGNRAVSGACDDTGETSLVEGAEPEIATSATNATLPAGTIHDVATVSGLTADATGTVDFALWANDECSGSPVFTSDDRPISAVVGGSATATSANYLPTSAGDYFWIATYSGDANNEGVAGECGDEGETSTVNPTNPAISTTATSGTLPPGTISDTATLTGVTGSAGGTITFRLFGPSASPDCSGAPVFTSAAVSVSGPGTYGPVTAPVSAGGSYYWIASYSGDANNNPVAGSCGDAGETSVVRVLQGALNVTKAVSPVAGGGVVVEFGDTLTYTLTVSATGELTQHDVKVSDYIPGYDPARPTSGKTTYVAGSATCVGAVTTPCTVTQPGTDHKITWALGDMAAGTTRQVTFKVTIDDVAGDPGETVAVDILNAGAVESRETPKKPSNEVITPVTKVLPVKQGNPPKVLPHTGSSVEPGLLAGTAFGLLGIGLLLMGASRRRQPGSHRLG